MPTEAESICSILDSTTASEILNDAIKDVRLRSSSSNVTEVNERIAELERLGEAHMQRIKLAARVLLTDLKKRGDDLAYQEDLLQKKNIALTERELRIGRLEARVRQREAAALEIAELDQFDIARGTALAMERRSLVIDRVRLNKVITEHNKKRRQRKRIKKHPLLTKISPEHAFCLYSDICLPSVENSSQLSLGYHGYGSPIGVTRFLHAAFETEILGSSIVLSSLINRPSHPLVVNDVLFCYTDTSDPNKNHLFITTQSTTSSERLMHLLASEHPHISICYISETVLEATLKDIGSRMVMVSGLNNHFRKDQIANIFSTAGVIEGIALSDDLVLLKYSSVTEALECMTIFSGVISGTDEESDMSIAVIPVPEPQHVSFKPPYVSRPAEAARSSKISRYLKFSDLPFSTVCSTRNYKPNPDNVDDLQCSMKHTLRTICPNFRWFWQTSADTEDPKKPAHEYAIVDLRTSMTALGALALMQFYNGTYITFADEKLAVPKNSDFLTGAWVIRERESNALRRILPTLKFKGKSYPDPLWVELRDGDILYSPEYGQIGVYDPMAEVVLLFMFHRVYKGVVVKRQDSSLNGNQSTHIVGGSVEMHVVSGHTNDPTKELMETLYASAEIAALSSTIDLPIPQPAASLDILCTGSWEIFETERTVRSGEYTPGPGEYMFVCHNVITNILTRVHKDGTVTEIGNYVPATGRLSFTYKGTQRIGEVSRACQSLKSHIAGREIDAEYEPIPETDINTFRVTEVRCLDGLNVFIVEHQSYYTTSWAMDVPPAQQREILLKISQNLSNSRKRKGNIVPLTKDEELSLSELREVHSLHGGDPQRHQLINLLAVAANKDAVDWWTIRKKEKRRHRPITFYTDKVTPYEISGTTLPGGELITGSTKSGMVTLSFKHNKQQTVVNLDCTREKWSSGKKPRTIRGTLRSKDGRESSCIMVKLADEIELEKVFREESGSDISDELSDYSDDDDDDDDDEEDEEGEEFEEEETDECTEEDSDFESDIHIPTVDWITVCASSTQQKVAKYFIQQLPS
eukprot:TRINITY_DN462_c3_g1_i1.p1 TRINITY_DN462_c3_g1~~TRINITY_DN462_c3_g1_i1.p1  ORF type:complete len:1049 (+),score=130.28 TRINITY_DN462_c3_g1_i1:34-3147(+)